MRKLIFSINVSLDGFADHTVAIADDELHDFSTAQLDGVSAVLFGRKTYQLFESFWPNAPEDPQSTQSIVRFARKINAMPKIVFSKTLPEAGWNNTRLVKGDTVGEVKALKQETGKDLAVGGISLIQTFLNLKLVDEYWLLVQPVIQGRGRRLFDGAAGRIEHKLLDATTFRSGVAVLHYAPAWESGREKEQRKASRENV